MKTALIVVDVQHFFLHDATDDLATNIARHIDGSSYDIVAFTVFKNTPDSNFAKSLRWTKCYTKQDIQLPREFTSYVADDTVFTRDTYSGFSGTTLHSLLQSKNIEKVVLCGVDTDACVLATAFSAFDHGYMIDVNADLTFSGGGLEAEAHAIMRRSLIYKK